MINIYEVGGAIRDRLMKIPSKDKDYAVEAGSYQEMKDRILIGGGTIYLEKPEFLTIRCKMPGFGDADFVLCRKDGVYYDGRHPNSVEPGTIYDDLKRRDFTMNAIAFNVQTNEYIDPHGGVLDIANRVIRCVGNAHDRFTEDALRMLRALRFLITKNMTLSYDIVECLYDPSLLEGLTNTSTDRVRDELTKCFKADTAQTLQLFSKFEMFRNYIFDTRKELWLKPTTEE